MRTLSVLPVTTRHQRVAAAGELPVSVSSEPVSAEALPARLATLLGS